MNPSFLLLLFLFALVLPLGAQPVGSDLGGTAGTTYLIAWPDTVTTTLPDVRYPNLQFPSKAYIHVYSAVDNRLRIRGEGYDRVVVLPAGTFRVIDLMDTLHPAPDPIMTVSNSVSRRSFRLEAEQPLIVYCYLMTIYGAEAWTPLPVDRWGREYFVAARPGEVVKDISVVSEFEFSGKSRMAPAEILFVAAYDSTVVSIASTGDLHGAPRKVEVMLDAGEVYQMQSLVDTSIYAGRQPDIGGTRIVASRPVGVISGNTRAQLVAIDRGLGQNIYKNMLMEWLTPVEQHGSEFVYMPTWDARRRTGTKQDDTLRTRVGVE